MTDKRLPESVQAARGHLNRRVAKVHECGPGSAAWGRRDAKSVEIVLFCLDAALQFIDEIMENPERRG